MAEFEPEFKQAPKDERDKLAQKKAEYEQALFDATQKEAFGKYDVTVPGEGEDTYQSYLDKRPEEGVIRGVDDTLVDAETNKFASKESYEAQNGTAQSYYDKLNGVGDQEPFDESTYERMGVFQLAKETVRARGIGDTAAEAEIRAALEVHLTIDALKDKTKQKNLKETPEQAQARYDAELAQYEQLVTRLSERSETRPPHATETHVEPDGEGHPSARAVDTPVFEAIVAETEIEPEIIEVQPEVVPAEPAVVEPEQTEVIPEVETPIAEEKSGGYYNGKKITVAQVTPHPNGDASKDALFVVDEDGETHAIRASEVEYTARTPGKELELYSEAPAVEAEESKEKGVKKWWGKIQKGYHTALGSAFWAAEWAKGGASKLLNTGVKEGMSEEEKEKKYKRNRNIAVAAGIGLAAVTLGSVIAAGISDVLDNANPNARMPGGGGGGGGVGNEGGEAPDSSLLDSHKTLGEKTVKDVNPDEGDGIVPNTDGLRWDDKSAAASEFIVDYGEGGQSLLESLGLNPYDWEKIAPTLLAELPGEFYVENGDIRIAHPGQLSERAQEIINSLR